VLALVVPNGAFGTDIRPIWSTAAIPRSAFSSPSGNIGSPRVTIGLTTAVDGTYHIAVTTGRSDVSYIHNVTVTNDPGSVAIAASNISGTLIQIGTPVASIVDHYTKPRGAFAVNLQERSSCWRRRDHGGNASVTMANPTSTSFDGGGFGQGASGGADGGMTAKFTVAGRWNLQTAVTTGGSGVSYTLMLSAPPQPQTFRR
jgi:hypothetical protein